jgi:hypothetical protein
VVCCRTGRDSARDTGRGPESSRSNGFPDSARSDAMISSRPTMSTARVHTSLAALSAERNVLESRLALIDAALEQEKTKIVIKSKAR